jgi:hypothetical protein
MAWVCQAELRQTKNVKVGLGEERRGKARSGMAGGLGMSGFGDGEVSYIGDFECCALVDEATDRAFGPLFYPFYNRETTESSRPEIGANEYAEAFLRWLPRDARMFSTDELVDAQCEFERTHRFDLVTMEFQRRDAA